MLVFALTGNDWTAIGSVGTMAAAIVGLVSLWAGWSAERQNDAAVLRDRTQKFVAEAERVMSMLVEGSSLVSAASHTASSLTAQVGDVPAPEEVRAIIGDSSAALTASVEGWASAPAAAELHKAVAELAATENGLSGYLGVFSPAAQLLRRVVDDGYSPEIFVSLLTGEHAQGFTAAHAQDDVPCLTRALAHHLYGNSSVYFAARYKPALDALRSFIQITAGAFADLGTRDLLRAGRAKVAISASSHTEDLRIRLRRLEPLFPQPLMEGLRALVDEIESSITTDSALKRLQKGRAES